MARSHPMTQAVRFLEAQAVPFEPLVYRYEAGPDVARRAAEALGLAAASTFKTLVFAGEAGPILVLIDAAHRVAPGRLAHAAGAKRRLEECDPRDAERFTGYRVGGISPFGTRRPMPVFLDAAALSLPRMHVNGGSHGFLVGVAPADLVRVLAPVVADLREGG